VRLFWAIVLAASSVVVWFVIAFSASMSDNPSAAVTAMNSADAVLVAGLTVAAGILASCWVRRG